MSEENIIMSWETKLYAYRARMVQGINPCNPREEWDNAGTMVCWHRRYDLGDNADRNSDNTLRYKIKANEPDRFFFLLANGKVKWNYPEHLLEANAEKIARKHYIILPLYLYDHSGITMSTGPFSCPWDSGQVGWIYFDKAKLAEEKWTEEQAVKYLEGEVETYDAYLTGNVYGYVIERRPVDRPDIFETKETVYLSDLEADEDADWEPVDSCSGYYGHDENKNGIKDAVEILKEYHVKKDAETFTADAVGAGI